MKRTSLLRVLVLLALVLSSAAALARPVSVQDSPGYVPLVDPESASVRLGRRTNAPLVSARFRGGAPTLDGLGRSILWALHHTQSDSLRKLCITDSEFRDILWREFPQSRPATGIHWDDAWKIMFARLNAGCSHALRDHGDHVYTLVSFKADSVARYRNFTLYSGLKLNVKDDEGQFHEWRWVRGVAERKGAFKIYSTED